MVGSGGKVNSVVVTMLCIYYMMIFKGTSLTKYHYIEH